MSASGFDSMDGQKGIGHVLQVMWKNDTAL